VIDYDNTAGFNKKNEPALVAAYTVDNPEKQRQCIAYSLDKGRTFTKYEGFDPEVGDSGGKSIGIDRGCYPQARTYTFGLNINF
jgi:hypothetical protein